MVCLAAHQCHMTSLGHVVEYNKFILFVILLLFSIVHFDCYIIMLPCHGRFYLEVSTSTRS